MSTEFHQTVFTLVRSFASLNNVVDVQTVRLEYQQVADSTPSHLTVMTKKSGKLIDNINSSKLQPLFSHVVDISAIAAAFLLM